MGKFKVKFEGVIEFEPVEEPIPPEPPTQELVIFHDLFCNPADDAFPDLMPDLNGMSSDGRAQRFIVDGEGLDG